VLAIGEATRALAPLGHVSADMAAACAGVVPNLAASGAYRGTGGEMLRVGVCAMIESLALSGLVFSVDAVREFQAHVSAAIVYDETAVQDAAIAAFEAMCKGIYSSLGSGVVDGGGGGGAPASAALLDVASPAVLSYAQSLRDGAGVPARVRRGHAAALGCLPPALMALHGSEAFASLLEVAKPTPAAHEVETDARRHALQSLTRLTLAVLPQPQAGGNAAGVVDASGPDAEQRLPAVFDALLLGMADYTIDSRGDIGSRVREEAMLCMRTLLTRCAACGPAGHALLDSGLVARAIAAVAKQAVEKIDRTRGLACEVLADLCSRSDPPVPHIPRRDEISALLCNNGTVEHWTAPRETFPRMVGLLRFDEYRLAVLSGLVVSVGGLTESLVKASSACLLSHLAECDDEQVHAFCAALASVLADNAGDDRVTVPGAPLSH
jgi:hypothetical protein